MSADWGREVPPEPHNERPVDRHAPGDWSRDVTPEPEPAPVPVDRFPKAGREE